MSAPTIESMYFSTFWRDTDWYFTMTVRLSDWSNRDCTFWRNRVSISDSHIVFGDHYIGEHDGRVCLVMAHTETEIEYIPFSVSISDITQKLLPHLVLIRGNEYRFNLRIPADADVDTYQPPDFDISIGEPVSYCTCSTGSCRECGVLDCGCIDVCRGRCGMRSWDGWR